MANFEIETTTGEKFLAEVMTSTRPGTMFADARRICRERMVEKHGKT